MDKFKVWNKKVVKKKDEPIYLRLVEYGDYVCLQVVDKYGKREAYGSILTIDENGIELHCSFNSDLGIKTTKKNRYVKLFKEGKCQT